MGGLGMQLRLDRVAAGAIRGTERHRSGSKSR
jgi:hypothetical protein